MKPDKSMRNIIENSVHFYRSRAYSEEEMIHDISQTLNISPDEVKDVVKHMSK